MARLTEGQKAFIVSRLACFYTPSEVAALVKEEFGLEIPRQQVAFYDPAAAQGGKELSQPLRDLYTQTRQAFLSDVTAIPIANQAYRLQQLQNLYQQHKKNPQMAKDLLEQAAKEVGGQFTNRTIVLRQLAKEVTNLSDTDLLTLLGYDAGVGGHSPAGEVGGGTAGD